MAQPRWLEESITLMKLLPISGAARGRLLAYLPWYERQLDALAAFWLRSSLDLEHGGYLVPTSREGRTIGTDKNMWCQARMTWMFAALYNQHDPRPEWLDAARLGRDFMVKHGYSGDGRWAYLLSREGTVFDNSLSLVTDNNTAMALAEFATASGSDADVDLILATTEQYLERVGPPAVDEFYHHSLPADHLYNTTDMVTLGGLPALRPFFAKNRLDTIARAAIHRILYVYAKDDHRTLFEAVSLNGEVLDTERGQRVNPGHALEACWFCLDEARRLGDERSVQRAAEVCRWSFELGWDAELGGLLAFTKPGGGPPRGPEAPVPWGERWNDRVWWVHSEALYALADSAAATGDPWYVDAFDMLHQYVDAHFVDHDHGEWYSYLDPFGNVMASQKGSWIKCFFHVPRNVLMIVRLLRRLRDEEAGLKEVV